MDSARTRWSKFRPPGVCPRLVSEHKVMPALSVFCCVCRFQQSSKSSSHPSTLQPGAKSESLREEMEEAANRMEICRVSHRPEPLQSHSLLPPLSPAPVWLLLICAAPACVQHKGAEIQVRCPLTCRFLFLFQDQLSADMYSFVAKEIDYANYFQTVSIDGTGMKRKSQMATFELTSISPQCLLAADRNTSRVSQEVVRDSPQRPAPD